jgi:predicted 3-demethylubiquinone-9 3-methyltransferase (glyoxalase superfamily)
LGETQRGWRAGIGLQLAKRQIQRVVATTPTVLIDMLHEKDPEKAERVMQAMLQMKKIEIEKLKAACDRK